MISHGAGSSPSPPKEGRGDAETDCLDIFQIAQYSPSRPGPSPRDSCTQGTLLTELTTSLCRPVYFAPTLHKYPGGALPEPLCGNALLHFSKKWSTGCPPKCPWLSGHLGHGS